MTRIFMLLLSALFITSCTKERTLPGFDKIFQKGAANATELRRVLTHYNLPNDSLKLKAAKYLVLNMEGFYYYEGAQLDQYLNYLKLIKRESKQGDYIFNSLNELYSPFSLSNLQKKCDLQEVKAADIIKNIDMAFKVWEEQPWGKDISFEQFCEYILPFRIHDELPAYSSREEIYRQFNPLLDTVRKQGGDAVMACKVINNKLKNDGWLSTDRLGFLPRFPVSKLIESRTGSCRDMTDIAIYVMRAVGIPVGSDFIFQWPYKSNAHQWNTVVNKQGKKVMFMAIDQNPGTEHKPGTKKGKIFRQTYAINPGSLAMLNATNEEIPPYFKNPRIKDVTAEYVNCFDVSVPLVVRGTNTRYAYLAVFNNFTWVPVHWGEIKDSRAFFTKMEGGIVYLPVCYSKKTGVISVSYPMVLDTRGNTKLLKPDSLHAHKSMIVDKMYPFMPEQFRVSRVWGGRFQGANQPDFSDAEDLVVLTDPLPFLNDVKVKSQKKFRFVRYIPAHGYPCDLSELEFRADNAKLGGKLIGNNGTGKPDTTMANVSDNDLTTRFVTKFSTTTWIGLDLGTSRKIDMIRYAVGMNKRKNIEIEKEDTYELFYWANSNGWVSAGVKQATAATLVFNNIPSNALYVLQNLSKKLDKRIFTYENGKQVWY